MNVKRYFVYPFWFYVLTFPFIYWDVLYHNESTSRVAFDPWKGLYIPAGVLAYLVLSDAWMHYLKPRLTGPERPEALRRATESCAAITRSRAYRWTRTGSVGVLVLLSLAFPYLASFLPTSAYQIDVATKIGLYIILALGLNIVVGLAGVLDLGFVAFYAVGAYTWALLASGVNGVFSWRAPPWSYPLVIVLAAILAGLFRLAIGWPALRLRGDYLAIVTLGFGEMMRYLLTNLRDYTGGSNGISISVVPTFFGWTLAGVTDHYYLVLIFVFITILAVIRLEQSRIGRAWKAIREDEVAAAAMGINTPAYLLLAYVLGGLFAGIAGAIFAVKLGFVAPNSFNLDESIRVLSMVVLGGMGSVPGVILGAALLYALPETFRTLGEYRMLLFGAMMVALMIYRPQGLLPPARGASREPEESPASLARTPSP